jgi:hypothetical protein
VASEWIWAGIWAGWISGHVFDGVKSEDRYSGILRLDGKAVSRFCAAKGSHPPRRCDMPGV